MSNLKEFSMNMPMIGIAGTMAAAEPTISAEVSLPPDVDPQAADHICVSVDSATVGNTEGATAVIDLVLSVGVLDQGKDNCSYYKLIKRIKLDKVKLAYEAESLTPVAVVEAVEDQAVVAQEMAAFHSARRAREMAGISESAGTKTFNVVFSYDDKKTEGASQARASSIIEIVAVKDKAHARHVFDMKYASKYPNAKITRVTETE